jgi:acyl transferase domain-containing protein/acyl carrier protein
MSDSNNSLEEVAIIGMACRFPGAANVEEFWRNLRDGIETVSHFTDEELLASGVPAELLRNPQYVKARGTLKGVDMFDAAFFGLNPREAEITDPQHRVFLETAWEALEDAGYDSDRYDGAIGVYGGVSMSTYLINLLSARGLVESVGSFQIGIGNDKDFMPTRVSYKLNLGGPSVSVQCACSTSLVAVSLAYQSLLNYQSDMALAGGVTIIIPQEAGYIYQEGGIVSPDGYCRAYGADARGTVGSNGVGIVVLKRLADALADGDHIYAVIKGAAVNNDGSDKIGYTAPSVNGQVKVIAEAHALAQVEPDSIGYVEGHGTGTALGDPIEVEALTQVFRASTQRTGFCALGSVKTNIGHTDSAAGVAGLIKATLALSHGELPPTLHFQGPNPQIDFASSPFYVNSELRTWERPEGGRRRAGVSSFGVGGTNAHLILEEAPAESPRPPEAEPSWEVLPVSARTPQALADACRRLGEHLRGAGAGLRLSDVAHTLQVGRRAFTHRAAVVSRTTDEAAEALAGTAAVTASSPAASTDAASTRGAGRRVPALWKGEASPARRPLIFLFPGQGVELAGAARSLYRLEPEFARRLDECAAAFGSGEGDEDVRAGLLAEGGEAERWRGLYRQTRRAQPALFAYEYALAHLLMWWGLGPSAAVGHSLGEYAAACVCGHLGLTEAAALVEARARLMQEAPEGSMLAVGLGWEEARRRAESAGLWVSAVNGERQSVLGGGREEVERLREELRAEGVGSQVLGVERAFHTGLMAGAAEQLVEEAGGLLGGTGIKDGEVDGEGVGGRVVPVVSCVSGEWMSAGQARRAGYWAEQMRRPVLFWEGLRRAARGPEEGGSWSAEAVALEVGPGAGLSRMAQALAGGRGGRQGARAESAGAESAGARLAAGVGTVTRPGEGDEAGQVREAAGRLWSWGVDARWERMDEGVGRRRVTLPAYPFERQRYWVLRQAQLAEPSAPSLRKKPEVDEWFYVPSWKRSVLPSAVGPEAPEGRESVWVVFAGAHEVGDELARELARRGRDVVTVRTGARFARVAEREYTINPKESRGYLDLLDDLSLSGITPTRFVHLWSVAPAGNDDGPVDRARAFAESQERGYYSLLRLAAAVGGQPGAERVRFYVVTSGAQEVSGDEPLAAESATVLGVCKVIPQEYPNIKCRGIDVCTRRPGSESPRGLAEQLAAEVTSGAAEPSVAYRGAHRWVESYEPVSLGARAGHPPRLRESGVYLITGGLGGIALVLARYLAEAVRARLVLVARTPLPPREEWEARLSSHDGQDGVAGKIRAVRELEGLGAEVLLASADVTDREQLGAAVRQAVERFGDLHGVFHTAGVLGEHAMNAIAETGVAESEQHFRPKVYGLYALDEVLRGRELDFCLLTSSLSSVLGGLGFSAYAAANVFMDAYAREQNRAAPGRWISVNWDAWQLAPVRPQAGGLGANLADLAITPEEGARAFQRVLSTSLTQVVVSTSDLQARIDQWVKLEARPDGGGAEPGMLHERPALGVAYVAPRDEVEQAVTGIWQSLLGIEQIGVEDNFFDLGGHSLLATQLVSRVRDTFQLELSLRDFFEVPTVAHLAVLITQSQALTADSEQLDRILSEIEAIGADQK